MSDHPVFPEGSSVAMVEQKGDTKKLGVCMRGGRFVCPLPEGYDGDTNIRQHGGLIYVAHPYLPALKCNPSTGVCELHHGALPNTNARRAA